MSTQYAETISTELNLQSQQVISTIALLDEGGTVPFIARYRKEATGLLDEVAIMQIRDRLEQLRELDKRRETILKSLEDQEVLSEELREKVSAAQSLSALEDIYLPYRPKRRTRATIAREKGLAPLADLLFKQDETTDPDTEAAVFIDKEKETIKLFSSPFLVTTLVLAGMMLASLFYSFLVVTLHRKVLWKLR